MPKKVLVVDDEPHIGYLVRMVLTRRGYEVVLALNGEDALSRSREALFDLFILDIAMPGINGFELCRQLRGLAHAANTPVVMLTARGDERAKMEALQAGAMEFITKPFSPKALQKRVEEIIGEPSEGDASATGRVL
jgi:two-component system alkaline phosphatase synthesis response regulator PhoP